MSSVENGVKAVAEINKGLEQLGDRFRQAFADADSEASLRQAYAAILGKKKGALTRVLALMRHVPGDQRRDVGAKVNTFKSQVEEAFAASLKRLGDAQLEAELSGRPADVTLPGRPPFGRGNLHPVLQTRDDLFAIFRDLGFAVETSPEVELEAINFTKLAFPPDHPATDMQDTFWVNVAGSDRQDALLRTHTSNTQVRVLSSQEPPLAVVSAGPVYRRDDDMTHSPMFHQMEGFVVDEGVSMADLKGVLSSLAQGLYGPGTPVRLRPSYFPFVEPGAEADVGCPFCSPASRSSCRVCKGTGWLEVLGCGMIHPKVLNHCGIDSKRYSGFAFGLGIDRLAMLRYGIPNIKLLFDNDPRFLSQF